MLKGTLQRALVVPHISILRRPHASLTGVSQVLWSVHDGNTPALPLFHPPATWGGGRVEKWGHWWGLDLYSKLVHPWGKLTGVPKKVMWYNEQRAL